MLVLDGHTRRSHAVLQHLRLRRLAELRQVLFVKLQTLQELPHKLCHFCMCCCIAFSLITFVGYTRQDSGTFADSSFATVQVFFVIERQNDVL